MSFRAAVLAAFVSAVSGSAFAQTQPFEPVEAPREWTVNLGGGGVYGFSPSGGKAERLNFTPWGDFTWRERFYGNPLDGVGYNLVQQDKVRAGVQLRPHYSGQSRIEGLELPDLGADFAAYAFYRVPGNLSVGGRLMKDVSGQTDGLSYYASIANQSITPVGLLQSSLYVRGGDSRINNAYFGVTPEESAATGLAVHRLDGGLQNVGAVLIMMTPLGDRWAVATMLNAERSLGDVADSPLIQARKQEEMAYRGALIVVRRFGSH